MTRVTAALFLIFCSVAQWPWLIGTLDGSPVGTDPKRPYYPLTIHEVVVDPDNGFANPKFKDGFLVQLLDADVKLPTGKARLFVKPPDANSGSWLLLKGTPLK